MAEALGIAASVVSLLTFAGSAIIKGYQISQAAGKGCQDVARLLAELAQLTGVLVAIDTQLKRSSGGVKAARGEQASKIEGILQASLLETRKLIADATSTLEKLENSRKIMVPVKLKLLEPELKRLTDELAHHKSVFVLCLGVATTYAVQLNTWYAVAVSVSDGSYLQEHDRRYSSNATWDCGSTRAAA